MREDMLRVLDQRDFLVKENQRLQEELEAERNKLQQLMKEQEHQDRERSLSTMGA
ncbi:hypothetical protein GLW00_03415 [Halobacillus litoralis]|uniref:Uncharacterized protein n=1 Tax=Halobacillus litoralis TaxID=45668 RepID=A0A845F6K8_9BACI|nr:MULTISPECIES: hypothetical protein [Halobacillus]MEC3883998.1 hypothetical protein [Halobacillus sp. HZG1]MYL69882.1 hypothetical protein [Halobacillus litoralis]